jgi:hypothetical protein
VVLQFLQVAGSQVGEKAALAKDHAIELFLVVFAYKALLEQLPHR